MPDFLSEYKSDGVTNYEFCSIVHTHRQFVLPIALHKQVGSRTATERIERALSRVGLTAVFGSPVTVVAERCTFS